jgi:hypothetical protein
VKKIGKKFVRLKRWRTAAHPFPSFGVRRLPDYRAAAVGGALLQVPSDGLFHLRAKHLFN